MSDEVIFRAANEEDEEEVLSLLNNVFNEQERSTTIRDHRYWIWKFKESPFGPSILSVGECDGTIIAVDNLWPWEFIFKAAVIRSVQPCDSVVNKKFRGKGIFKKLRQFGINRARASDIAFSFNFPNSNSLPGNLSIGAHYLGKIPWHVKIYRPIHIVKNYLLNNDEETASVGHKYNVDPNLLDHIASKSMPSHRYLNVHRTKGYHRWRYKEKPNRKYGMVCSRNSKNYAAMVFTINFKGNIREMIIVDILGAKELLNELIVEINQAAKFFKVDYVALMKNEEFKTTRLWRHGFLNKKIKNMVALPIKANLDKEIKSVENWSLIASIHDSV